MNGPANFAGHFGECDVTCGRTVHRPWRYPGSIDGEGHHMSKNQRHTPRKPATKFAHLQKKMREQKVQVKKSTGKKK